MSQYRHILVVMDPAMRKTPALDRGVALAKKTGAELTLLLVDYKAGLVRANLLDRDSLARGVRGFLKERRDWLSTVAAGLADDGVTVHTDAAWGKPLQDEIVWRVLELKPDLVIKDARVEERLKRVFFTPLDWHLLRQCPAPLMLVSPYAGLFPQRVLAAIDPMDSHGKPGELNAEILRAALGMAYQTDAEVHVIHAVEFLPIVVEPAGESAIWANRDFREEVIEMHREALHKFADKHSVPAERLHLREGSPDEVIAQFAREIAADLVVMGTVNRTGLVRVVIGSTAERILDQLNCDVLALKPGGFVSDLERELLPRPEEALAE